MKIFNNEGFLYIKFYLCLSFNIENPCQQHLTIKCHSYRFVNLKKPLK